MAAQSVNSAAMALEGLHHDHDGHRLPAGALGVGDEGDKSRG